MRIGPLRSRKVAPDAVMAAAVAATPRPGQAPRYTRAVTIAAIVAALLLGALVAFQLALALGAPWGHSAWGGAHQGVLPTRLRVASALAGLVIYPLVIVVILASANLIDADWLPLQGAPVLWALVGLMGVGALANAFSRSRRERYWSPVALAIAICCAVIAIGI